MKKTTKRLMYTGLITTGTVALFIGINSIHTHTWIKITLWAASVVVLAVVITAINHGLRRRKTRQTGTTTTNDNNPKTEVQATQLSPKTTAMPPPRPQRPPQPQTAAEVTPPAATKVKEHYDDGTTREDEKGRKRPYNHLKTIDGRTWWVIARHKRKGRRKFFKKASWSRKEWRLLLDDSIYVDPKLVKRIDFEPTNDDTVVTWLRLPKRWSRGPAQITTMLLLLGFYAGWWWLMTQTSPISLTVQAICLAIVTLPAVVFCCVLQIKWRSTFQLATNLRFAVLFQPPLGLNKRDDTVFLNKLSDGIVTSANPLQRFCRYGTVYSETAAEDTDQWIRDGITYVADYEELASRLRQSIVALEHFRR